MLGSVILVVSIFLALNMGASGFAVSFTPSYGSGILGRKWAVILYTIGVLVGAFLFGERVVTTLASRLIKGGGNPWSSVSILLSATVMMFLTNLAKIPQSTSFVMVGAFTGAGLFYGKTDFYKLGEIFVVAMVFSFISFMLTFLVMKNFYPPREKNLYLYEKMFINSSVLRKWIIGTDCYSAFAVGTNNVANVVAPLLVAYGDLNAVWLLLCFAPLFGLGGWILGKGVITTVSKNIIPLGEISAGVISLITSSFVILASILGLPTPYVQFTTFSVLAVSAIKDGITATAKKDMVRRILFAWIIVPFLTGVISYLGHLMLQRIMR